MFHISACVKTEFCQQRISSIPTVHGTPNYLFMSCLIFNSIVCAFAHIFSRWFTFIDTIRVNSIMGDIPNTYVCFLKNTLNSKILYCFNATKTDNLRVALKSASLMSSNRKTKTSSTPSSSTWSLKKSKNTSTSLTAEKKKSSSAASALI